MNRIVFFLLCTFGVFAQESVFSSDLENAQNYNMTLNRLRSEVQEQYFEALAVSEKGGDETEYKKILQNIRALKQKISGLQEEWRGGVLKEGASSDEAYALWDVGETTLSQLIMEYGATDYLYVIPQELSAMKMTLFSSIPLPRESWGEMIEMILNHNGVGVKKLNSFAKQLYVLKLDPCAIEGIVSREEDLEIFLNHARLFFVLSPPVEQIKSLQGFFEKFSDPKQVSVQAVGSKIVLISTRDTIEKLLGLYHAVWKQEQGKVVRLLRSTKMVPQEAEKVLKAFFSDSSQKRPNFNSLAGDELTVLSLPQGLVLVGENETVTRGERVIADLEEQLDDPGEKVIYWYSCKHTSPEDIAEVLEKVYDSLIGSGFEKKGDAGAPSASPTQSPPSPAPVLSSEPSPAPMYPGQNTIFNPVLPANPPFVQPGVVDKNRKTAFGNFIVDPKTTSILMVVRREELPKIKALLKKMDVPKRMVQIEVLLVEKKLTDRKQLGFDLLQFGTNASQKNENAVTFNAPDRCWGGGVLSYIFSRQSGKFPAVDMRYNFLLAQEDVSINTNLSVLMVNQTSQTMSIVDEISINNGSFPIQTQSGVLIEQSFTRAQYGTTIVLTPTIHLSETPDENNGLGFVSLHTDVEFDTTQISFNERPPVTRRHIENEVCIPDGETVILGGLRSRIAQDTREKIPFLGDIPGIGKLFGLTKQADINTEMFIFITPHIVKDSSDDLRRIRQEEYQKRAGDLPQFLVCLDEAKNAERKKTFSNSLKMLFDMY